MRAQAAKTPPALRDAHAKADGVVKAEFRVLDGLPPSLAMGLFARPGVYQAWIRFSNGSGTPQNDSVPDGRGMAIKVMGVEGSLSTTQDFLMIDNPTFFVRNAADYVIFQNTISNPLKFFFPQWWNPFSFRLHEAMQAQQIAGQTVSNPLNIRYFSMAPYLYGTGPAKFSAIPAGTPSPFAERTTPNFLRDNMVQALSTSEAVFDFCIQLRTNAATMPVEDPTIVWPEAQAPFVPVARITIPVQVFNTPEQNAFAENLSYTPWHGLDAHRPLGGINRVRRVVYDTISRLRHQLNNAPRVEPQPEP